MTRLDTKYWDLCLIKPKLVQLNELVVIFANFPSAEKSFYLIFQHNRQAEMSHDCRNCKAFWAPVKLWSLWLLLSFLPNSTSFMQMTKEKQRVLGKSWCDLQTEDSCSERWKYFRFIPSQNQSSTAHCVDEDDNHPTLHATIKRDLGKMVEYKRDRCVVENCFCCGV